MMTSTTPPSALAILFSHGFRFFFLSAGLFACLAILLWLHFYASGSDPSQAMSALDWHTHEMVFGYGGAVVAGFLLTAIPNWTGMAPRRGPALIALAVLWLAGRVAMLSPLPPVMIAAMDVGFFLTLAWMAARDVIAARNWRNMVVIGPVSLLAIANLMFHIELMTSGSSDIARRLGMAILVFLITLIGGRIIPAFTRNWLRSKGAETLPSPMQPFDKLCLGVGAAGLLAWVATPDSPLSATVLLLAGILHLVRLFRWQGHKTLPNPLLLMIHLAYAFVPAGMIALSSSGFGWWAGQDVGSHLLGMGAIGGMTLAVMMRASLGHSGRPLRANGLLVTAFALVIGAVFTRAGFAFTGLATLSLSAALWCLGFLAFAAQVAPWMITPRADGKDG